MSAQAVPSRDTLAACPSRFGVEKARALEVCRARSSAKRASAQRSNRWSHPPPFQLRRTLLALGSELARCRRRQPRLGRLRMGVVADIPSPAKRIWQPHTRRQAFGLGASFFRCGRTQTRPWAHSRTDEIGPSCQWATALGSAMALLLYIAPDTDATINSCFIGAFGNADRCPRGCRWQLSVRKAFAITTRLFTDCTQKLFRFGIETG